MVQKALQSGNAPGSAQQAAVHADAHHLGRVQAGGVALGVQRIKTVFAVKKELADIGALNAVPFSATARIGLEEATLQIENWISPKVVP